MNTTPGSSRRLSSGVAGSDLAAALSPRWATAWRDLALAARLADGQ